MIYLDNAATSFPKPEAVYAALDRFARHSLAEAGRIALTRIAADAGGTIDPDAVKVAITPKTRLIALTHASNVLGTVQPIAEVGRIARDRDLLFLVDAAQTAGVVPL